MARTAKIALTADIRGFKKATDDAKLAIQSIGKANISPEAEKKLKEIVSKDLAQKAKTLKAGIQSITSELEKMGKATGAAHDVAKVEQHAKKLADLQKAYDGIVKAQKQIASGKFPDAEGGGGGKGGLGALFGRGNLIAAAAGALGIRSAWNTRTEMARQRLDVAAVTSDQGMGNERSQFGFTPEERRRRLASVARAAGSVTGQQATRLAEVSELAQRAYGIDEDVTSGAIKTATKSGVTDQAKFVSSAIGAAVANGLSGSKIGDYLSSMTSYMASMSEGINIDDGSLNGFASAMGGLPFFKNDPNRIFAALQGLNQMFKGGDAFQKGQATRAILGVAPGAGPAATEFRRSMGLFGTLDPETMANLKQAGMGGAGLKAIGAGGPEIIKNIFDEVMKSTAGMSTEDRLYEFQQRTGMEPGAAASIFGRLATGKGIDVQKLKEATMSPEELLRQSQDRLNKTMGTLEGKFVDLNATLAAIGEDIAANIARPFAELGGKIDELIKALGLDTVSVGGAVGTAAAVAGGAVALGAGAKLAKGAAGMAKGASRLGKATMKGGVKGGAKAATRMMGKGFGKMFQRAIPGVGLIMAGKDAWDVYDKYKRGEQITPKDWAVLSTSTLAGVAGLIPGLGTAASVGLTGASVGAEFLPDDIGMSGGGAATPATPSSGLPVKPGFEMTPSGMTGTPSNVIPGPWKGSYGMTPDSGAAAPVSAVQSGKEQALGENTMALKELTGALLGSKGSAQFGGRYPSGAAMMGPGMAPGKR